MIVQVHFPRVQHLARIVGLVWLILVLMELQAFPPANRRLFAVAYGLQEAQVVLADQLLAEAEKLRAARTEKSFRAAIEKYKEVLPLWRKLGNRAKESMTLYGLCSAYNGLSERQQALGYCEEALVVRQELNDQPGEAEALNLIGNIQLALHGPQPALSYFQRALDIRRAGKDQRGIAVTSANLSRLYGQLGESQKQLELLLEALPMAQAAKDRAIENNIYTLLADCYNNLGQTEMALDYYQQSLTLSRTRKDISMEAGTLSNLGASYYDIGLYQKAIDTLSAALTLYRSIGNSRLGIEPLITLAGSWNSLGEPNNALSFANEALKLAQENSRQDLEFYAQQTLGGIYRNLGDAQKALGYDQKSLALAEELGIKKFEALALSRLAIDWQQLNDWPKALEFGQQAIVRHRESSDLTELMYSLHELCRTQIKLNAYQAAQTTCDESLKLSRLRGDRESEAKSLLEHASLAARQGDWSQAKKMLEEALQIFDALGYSLQNSAARTSFLDSNYGAYERYIDLLMKRHRADPAAKYDRQALQASERARARILLTRLAEARTGIRQGVDAALLEREQRLLKQLERKAVEKNRLSSKGSNAEKFSVFMRELIELSSELEQVQAQIKVSSPRYAALTQPQPLGVADIQKEVVTDKDTLLLEYALGEEQSFLWTVSANSFNSYELPKGELIEQASQHVYDLLTARNQPVKFETAEERTARIKKADAEFPAAAAALSRMILAPAAAELRAKRPKQLLIVADGKLQYVPFAALPMPTMEGRRDSRTGGQRDGGTAGRWDSRSVSPSPRPSVSPSPNRPVPLIANYEIVNLPSASTLAVLRRELKGRTPAPKTVAVFADPVFEADDERLPKEVRERLTREKQAPAKDKAAEAALATDELTRAIRNVGLDGERGGLRRLVFSRDEANAILKLAPEAARFSALDFDANQDAAIKPEMSQYRYVHFATHGLVDNQTPDLSGLVLSQLDAEGRSRDGYLRMVEIYNLNLPAELVVLSACKTGLGKEVRGEGLMSLTRGFMYAGAARVMVSLWDVNDKSTAGLMSELYQGLLTRKQRPSAALRAAQLKLLNSREFAAPYFWAAFTQHGEPK